MIMYARNHITPDSALGGWQMKRSLRWEGTTGSSGSYLYRTGSSPTGGGKYSYSSWIKRAAVSYQTCLWGAGGGSQTNTHAEGIYITGSDQIALIYRGAVGSGSIGWYAYASAKLRDVTSWMHIMLTYDNNQSGIANKIKYYFNGVEVPYGGGVGSPGDLEFVNKSGVTQYMGRMDQGSGPGYARVYQAETHVADGYIWTPSDFGYTDAQTGQWRPKRPEDISVNYGNNGFYLDYADNTSTSTIGIDRSGNSNNWTASGFSVSAGSENDSLIDTPTNNFATINPLHGTSTMYDTKNGNLDFNLSNNEFAISTIYLPTSGKWYAECVFTTIESGDVGVFNPDMIDIPDGELSFDGRWSGVRYGKANGTASIYTDNSAVQTGLTLISNNDIVGILADRDAGTISFTINGTAKGTPVPISTITDSSTLAFRASRTSSGGSNVIGYFNFGQRPFSHLPTGYRSLCSKNLATPSAAQIVRSQRHFDTVLWSGNGTNGRIITDLEFQPDLVWIKCRSNDPSHKLFDVIRGGGKVVESDDNSAEETNQEYGYLSAFNTNGFTLTQGTNGSFPMGNVNHSGRTYVAWCWKAGGAAVSNSDGSITSQVSANQEAGFSVVTYTGTGSNATVGHGLGKAPKWVLVKRRDATGNWAVYHEPSYSSGHMQLDTTVAPSNEPWWNGQATSSVFNLKTSATINGDTATYVAYCWAEIPGYSKFGTYRGDGSADGPYINLGFRPAWFMQKKLSGTGGWYIFDSKRSGYNVDNDILVADVYDAEYDGASYPRLDFLANGIKWRDSGSSVHNASGATYVYMAFAERPSGTIFGLDANAR